MRRYARVVGKPLDGIFLDMIEWKPSCAETVLDGNAYRQGMLSLFNEIRTAIGSEYVQAELSGNAGAIHNHGNYTLLDRLDRVLSEDALGYIFSGGGDKPGNLTAFLDNTSSSKTALIIGLDGGNGSSFQCPSPDQWNQALELYYKYPSRILISADYGPYGHGNLNCFPTTYVQTVTYDLSVTKSGTGYGTVTPDSGTITWSGNTGTASYTSGTSVVLTATAASGSTFTSWIGCDSTSGSQCTITMSSNKSVKVVFTSGSSDNATAAAAINEIYNQYASWFGSTSGGIVTGTSGGFTYYAQWFTNGAALVAWTDGTMFTYYNGAWYQLGAIWR
ncbi:MAG: hypothetical protein HQK96_14680 [Nitrospirae bacterium]|nr:hypothetical protein [Nitrospirota bacterium]